jgi:hypothetical protein
MGILLIEGPPQGLWRVLRQIQKGRTKQGENKMKKTIIMVACLIFLVVSVGCELDVDSTKTYMGGRMLYYGLVETLQPETLKQMEVRFDQLLEETQGLFLIPPDKMMAMFNDQVAIISSEIEYTYGLLGDLTFLLNEAGAVYNESGELIDIESIRRELFVAFSIGYRNSRTEYIARQAR